MTLCPSESNSIMDNFVLNINLFEAGMRRTREILLTNDSKLFNQTVSLSPLINITTNNNNHCVHY